MSEAGCQRPRSCPLPPRGKAADHHEEVENGPDHNLDDELARIGESDVVDKRADHAEDERLEEQAPAVVFAPDHLPGSDQSHDLCDGNEDESNKCGSEVRWVAADL